MRASWHQWQADTGSGPRSFRLDRALAHRCLLRADRYPLPREAYRLPQPCLPRRHVCCLVYTWVEMMHREGVTTYYLVLSCMISWALGDVFKRGQRPHVHELGVSYFHLLQ
jgi:hypothetical protein